MIVGVKDKFDAAHFLPNYPGKCAEMHGHTWTVTVEVEGSVSPASGMVIDFAGLKAALRATLERLDHKTLNDMIRVPTCENVAAYVHGEMLSYLRASEYVGDVIRKPGDRLRVTVQEGDGGWARTE